jgi:dihydroflavonol-4-reductase
MRLWVGGATGFLGSHLVRVLRSRGHEVVGAALGGGRVDDAPVADVDVLDPQRVAASAQGCEGAFLATGRVSRDPADALLMHRLHVFGTRSALQGLRAAGVRRVVVASTSGTIAIGTDPDQVFDETAPVPMEHAAAWPYYRTKIYGEREALLANAPPDFEVVVVNPSLLLGPGDVADSSTGDVRRFLERSVPAVPAGGIAFVDARDAALGMALAFERGRPGERYLLSAANLTLRAFFERLARMTGIDAPWLRLPRSRTLAVEATRLFRRTVLAIGGKPPVDLESVEMGQYFWYCDAGKAARELGWVARDPGETLRDTIEDLRQRKLVIVPERR